MLDQGPPHIFGPGRIQEEGLADRFHLGLRPLG